MSEKTRVMIVDDQLISRRFFELTLGGCARYEVVCALASAFTADLYLLKEEIDLIVMDVLINNGVNGLDAAETIKQTYPAVKIVIVTSMPEYSWMERAREIGIESFWFKEADEISILEVLDRTVAGELVYPVGAPPVKLGKATREDFSDRELDVLRGIAAGKSNSDIAESLFISENTIKTHVRTLLHKTGYANRTELAVHARVVGLALDPKD